DVGTKFKMLFCIYPGLETELLEKNVGVKGLEHVFTYVPPSELDYPVNFGLNGQLKTLDGTFALDDTGGQIGELTPLGQLELDDHRHLKFVSVYPHETATGKIGRAH